MLERESIGNLFRFFIIFLGLSSLISHVTAGKSQRQLKTSSLNLPQVKEIAEVILNSPQAKNTIEVKAKTHGVGPFFTTISGKSIFTIKMSEENIKNLLSEAVKNGAYARHQNAQYFTIYYTAPKGIVKKLGGEYLGKWRFKSEQGDTNKILVVFSLKGLSDWRNKAGLDMDKIRDLISKKKGALVSFYPINPKWKPRREDVIN